jgi:hypothetical protein
VSHDVVLTGFRLNTGEPPAKVLERVLGLEPAKARAATQRFPVILARTSQERADQLAEILREAGAMVDVREAMTVARPSAQMAQATAVASAPAPPLPPAPALPPPGIRAVPTPLGATAPRGLPTVAGMPPLPGMVAKGGVASGPAPALGSLASPAATPAPALEPFAPAAPEPAPPALSIAQPENDWNMQALAPVLPPIDEPLEPMPAPAAPPKMTAYQLGDLALDLGKKPAAPAASTGAAAFTAGALDAALPAAESGAEPASAGLELESNATPAMPAPARAVAAEAPAFGGMQSFGDGFDDMNQGEEASLELDRDASWLSKQKKEEAAKRTKAAAPAPAGDEFGEAPLREPRRAPPPKLVAPAPLTFKQRVQYALYEVLETTKVVLLHALAIAAMAVITSLAVAYGRSPDALFELVGLSPPPTPSGELRIPVVSPLAIPPLLGEARIHPVLRLVPEQLSLEVATALRARVPGWHHIDVKWPRPDDVKDHNVECMIVEHKKGDKNAREVASRVNALLRTGQALELPAEVQKTLRDAMLSRRDEQGLKKHFTQLCLAL